MNKVKRKLREGGTVFVLNPNFPSAALIEHAGSLGFDAAFIDCEHGTAGFERVEELARAARAAGMTSILRPWSAERGLVTRFLDCGVGGIQFPGIESADAAGAAVDIVRAARGAAFDDTLVTAMIESTTAMTNLPGIVEVAGLDALVIGLADLAVSLGHPGEPRHHTVHRAVEEIIAVVADAHGPAAGFNLHQWEDGPELAARGVRWFTIHARTMLARGTRELFALLDRNR